MPYINCLISHAATVTQIITATIFKTPTKCEALSGAIDRHHLWSAHGPYQVGIILTPHLSDEEAAAWEGQHLCHLLEGEWARVRWTWKCKPWLCPFPLNLSEAQFTPLMNGEDCGTRVPGSQTWREHKSVSQYRAAAGARTLGSGRAASCSRSAASRP